MKNIDYNSLLMYISLVFAIAILFSILFGCSYKKNNNYREYFETQETQETSDTSKSKSKNNSSAKLSEKEEKFKEQIKGGMDEQTLQNFVVENNVSNENLQNIIESFKKELFSNS